MIKENWHTHTKRCGHAVGEDEEYVQAAIQAGMKVLGFSDHAAYLEPFPPERMNYEQVPDYMSSIRSLKEKYKDQIELHLGMEVEYYPDQWEQLSAYRKELEYCILGQHQITFNGKSSYSVTDRETLLSYVDKLEEACMHGLCDYIAHPDVILYGWQNIHDEAVKVAAKRIADISIKYDMPLELNCGSGVLYPKKNYMSGLRYAYPTREFFEEFAKHHCKIIIGIDCHDPKLFLTDENVNKALSVVEGLSLNFVEHYDLIGEANKRKALFY